MKLPDLYPHTMPLTLRQRLSFAGVCILVALIMAAVLVATFFLAYNMTSALGEL